MKKLFVILLVVSTQWLFGQTFSPERVYSTFETFRLPIDSFNNGSDSTNAIFEHFGRFFPNSYNPQWGSWSGWALSTMRDSATPGLTNQFSAITGSGVGFSRTYAIANGSPYVKLDEPQVIEGAYFTNTTYTYLDIKNGSGFSKKFGGDDGNDPDFFKLIIKIYLDGDLKKETELMLADYTFEDNRKDYIVNNWQYVSFNDLNMPFLLDSIAFSFEGSDTGEFGLNTPKYFAMDDFNAYNPNLGAHDNSFYNMPQNSFYNGSNNAGGFLMMHSFFPNNYNSNWDSWNGWALSTMNDQETKDFSNQYSAMNPINSEPYLVSFGSRNEIINPIYDPEIQYDLRGGFKLIVSDYWDFYINNTVYGYYAMKEGGQFNKKFGGESGNDPDFFRLLIHKIGNQNERLHSDTIYLADYRFENNEDDYIVKDWIPYNVTKNKDAYKLEFELQSSDTGQFGMNNPAYFAMFAERDNSSISKLNHVEISVYPNPANEVVNISTETTIKNIKVYGLDGKIWFNQKLDAGLTQISINVANLPKSLYVVEIITVNGVGVKKVVVR